jgi:amino acid adenylation domain-containing protein
MSHIDAEATETSLPRSLCLHHLLETQAKRRPDAVAFIAPGRTPLTYGRLRTHVAEVVKTLRALGIGRNDRVAIVLPQGPEMATASIAVAAGATSTPLNPAYRVQEFEDYLTGLQAKAILIQAGVDSPARVVAQACGLLVIELSPVLEGEAGLFTLTGAQVAPPARDEFAGPADMALVLPTSGTTARPKIVPLTQTNICTSAFNVVGALALSERDRCLNVVPLFHIYGLISGVLASLAAGGSVVCPPGFYAPQFLAWLEEFAPTWYTAAPTMHQAILTHARIHPKPLARRPLRFIRSASAPLPPQVAVELEDIFGVPVIESYGTTETSSQITINPLPPRRRKLGSVGVAAGPEVAIMDEAGHLLLAGATGEVVVRGATVMQGYENTPNGKEAAFIDGWFRTGDIGYLDAEGYLFITGRLKEIINRGGEKIAPREVEEVLLEHPAVAEVVAFALPHAQLGEDVAAAVVLHNNTPVTELALREFATRRLAEFKVPRRVIVVPEIPMGSTGKPQRLGLAEKLGLMAADHEALVAREGFIAPDEPLEARLAEIWAAVLGVERAGIHDDFFALGGDSVLAVQLLSQIRQVLQVELSLLTFLEAPTIAAMISHIVSPRQMMAAAPPSPSIQPRYGNQELPLSYAQQRLWFLEELEPGNRAYILPKFLCLTGHLDVAAFEQSLNEIVRRHGALRTTFAAVDGRPFQVISPYQPLHLPVVDLAGLPEAERSAQAQHLASEESQRPFDLRRGPLLRAILLRLSEAEHILLLTIHHLVFDGWSEGVFRRELTTLYTTFSAGKPSPLAELPIQYADFAAWERDWLQGEVLETHLAYWRKQLEGIPPLLNLPTDRPRHSVQIFRGGREPVALSPTLTNALKALSQREGVTLFMTLLAAFQALLCRYTGQYDISVGTFNANRPHPKTEGLIGFFINNLVLRTDLSGDPSFPELLVRVRKMTLGAYTHQDLPFEKLLQGLQPKRSIAHSPLVQVMLVLQNTPRPPLELPDLTMSRYTAVESDRSTFDLTLWLSDETEGLTGSLEYNAALFVAPTIRRMVEHFQTFLECIAANPDLRLSALPMVSGAAADTTARRARLTERRVNLSPAKQALLEKRLRGMSNGVSQPPDGPQQLGQGRQAPSLQPISRRSGQDSPPLSFAQQRLWFLDQLEPDRSLYHVSKAVRLSGVLNVEALRQALDSIMARHEALRTNISAADGQPVQVIRAPQTVALPVIDLRGWDDAEREAELQRLLAEESRRPFNLTCDLMLRAMLLRLADEQHILLLAMHHIASDGWSMGVLIREFSLLYNAAATGRTAALSELPIQYADYALWQRQRLQGEVLEAHLSYWKHQLAGAPAVLELPTDRPRPAVQVYHGARQSLTLPPALSTALKSLSQREGVTLFMTLLAAFQTVLQRYTGRDDIVVGSPIAGRLQPETEDLIGFFVNTLVLRTDLSGNPTFRALLHRVRETALEAYAHQELPFEKLVEELQPERTLSYAPLFQVMFVLQNAQRTALELTGLTIQPLDIERETAKFDLSLVFIEEGTGLRARLAYNTDLFDDATMVRLLRHFRTLLEGIVAAPDTPIAQLPLLTTAERHQLLVGWNQTHVDGPKDSCVHELFEAQVARTPDAVAVVHADRQLSYRELNTRANQLAHYLQRLGVGPEVPVGLFVERSLDMIVGLLGILKAGGVYVPLDWALPQERLAFMLQDTQASLVLTQQCGVESLPQVTLPLIRLDMDWALITQEPAENPDCATNPAHLAYIIYTSGTTGTPKGVMIQQRSLAHYTETAAAEFGIGPGDRVLQFASIGFDTAAEEIFPCLIRGATLVLRTDEMLETVSSFLQQCHDWEITTLDLPTAYWHEVTAQLAAEVLELPPAVRLVIIGGERALPARLATWYQRVTSRVRLVNTYGPTEATVVATICDLSPPATDVLPQEVPIGRPIRDVRVYLLDRFLQPVPIGVAGEIYIGGAGVSRGYLNRPGLTAERFLPDPFSNAAGPRLYRTGDLARYRPDGCLEFVGRADHQVKLRGFRIELGEIEAILGQHPAVREAVALAWEDAPGGKRLVAYVVPTQQPTPTTSELRLFLQKKLPDYMVPSAFVILNTLPLTPNGKVDRRGLPAPERVRPMLEDTFVPPRNLVEEAVAKIWAEILRLERVGIDDNFFDLGGHSLLATQLMSRVRATFYVELSLRSLFQQPTVAAQAQMLAKHESVPGQSAAIARVLAKMETMSADEICAILQQKQRHKG